MSGRRTWWTSDLHFRHDRVIEYCARPWTTADEMDEALIERINSVVAPDDRLFILGDVAMKHEKAKFLCTTLPRIHGEKVVVVGNHDRLKHFANIPTVVHAGTEFYEQHQWSDGQRKVRLHIHMTHLPQLHRLPSSPGEMHLYLNGHVHQAWTCHENMVNVGVDVWGYMPITLDDILGVSDLWFPEAVDPAWTWLVHLSFAIAVGHDRRYREGHPPVIG